MRPGDRPRLNEGDEVLIREGGGGHAKLTPAIVVKVGRALYHVQPVAMGEWARQTFHIKTWGATGRQYGYGTWLTTEAIEREHQRCDELAAELRRLGLIFTSALPESQWSSKELEGLVRFVRAVVDGRKADAEAG